MNKKHLTYDDRLVIQAGLQQRLKVAQIAKNIGKNRSTVSREIKAHRRLVSTSKGNKLYPSLYLHPDPRLPFKLFPRKETVQNSLWSMPGKMHGLSGRVLYRL